MRLFTAGARGRRARVPIALLLLAVAAAAAFLAPALTVVALLSAVLLLVWERAAVDREMRQMAALLASDDIEAKIEVGSGGWGELCHAINRLLQQRRSQQRLQRLLGAPPAAAAAHLAELSLPLEGLSCEVAVLAIGPLPGYDDPVEQLRFGAFAAVRQAEAQGALIARSGEALLLIFGGLGGSRAEASLRAAQRAAYGLRDSWASLPTQARPVLSLAGGSARGVVLPGLGYSIVGPPVEQALALLSAGQPTALVCSESVYLQLRRLGSAPPLPAAPRRASASGPIAYAVPL